MSNHLSVLLLDGIWSNRGFLLDTGSDCTTLSKADATGQVTMSMTPLLRPSPPPAALLVETPAPVEDLIRTSPFLSARTTAFEDNVLT